MHGKRKSEAWRLVEAGHFFDFLFLISETREEGSVDPYSSADRVFGVTGTVGAGHKPHKQVPPPRSLCGQGGRLPRLFRIGPFSPLTQAPPHRHFRFSLSRLLTGLSVTRGLAGSSLRVFPPEVSFFLFFFYFQAFY